MTLKEELLLRALCAFEEDGIANFSYRDLRK